MSKVSTHVRPAAFTWKALYLGSNNIEKINGASLENLQPGPKKAMSNRSGDVEKMSCVVIFT